MRNLKKIFLMAICMTIAIASHAYDFEVNGIYYNITSLQEKTVEVTYGGKYYSGDIIVPHTVEYSDITFTITRLGDKAFMYCSEMTSIQIPNTVITLGSYIFYGCSKLTSLSIPASVTEIGAGVSNDYGKYCFWGCSNLGSLKFEDSENSLTLHPNAWTGGLVSTFESCKLTSIYLGRNIYAAHASSPDRYPFYGQYRLTSIEYGPLATTTGVFSNCYDLKQVTIPGTISSISAYAFQNCSYLEEVTFSEGLTSIGEYAFKDCPKLKSIVFPSTINKIYSSAFENSSNITKVFSKSITPPSINESTFPGIVYLTAKLYVPINSQNVYESAKGWKDFSMINEWENFDDLTQYYNLNLSAGIGGKVNMSDSMVSNSTISTRVAEGDIVKFSVSPDEGYRLKSVIINGIEENTYSDCVNKYIVYYGGSNLCLSTNEVADKTHKTYSLSTIPEHFYIESKEGSYTIKSAETDKFVGYTDFPSWDISNNEDKWDIESLNGELTTINKTGTNVGLGVDNVGNGKGIFADKQEQYWRVINQTVVDGNYIIPPIMQNTDVVVTFEELPIYLTIKSTENGYISQVIEKGNAYSFIITPNENQVIEKVSFNGEDVTNKLVNNIYTTPAIFANSELKIVYNPVNSTETQGDMNGDGELTIGDVTSLVNKIIKK